MFSVTSEPAASASIQAGQPKTGRPDRAAQSDNFGALLDSSVPVETQASSSAARQTSASQRRADDDAASTSDRGRSRGASTSRSSDAADDQSPTRIADDGGPEVRQASDAGASGATEKKRTPTKSGSSKDTSAQQSDQASAGTASSADPAAATPQDPASVIIPTAIAVAIPVQIALRDVPADPTSNVSSAVPLALATAARSVAAGASAAPAPASPPHDQSKIVSNAADATASASSSIPASDAAPVIPATTAAPAVGSEKAAVIEAAVVVEAARQTTALPIPQAMAQTEATPANDVALTAAAVIPAAAPKTTLPKAAAAASAKATASTSDGKTATADRSATGTDVGAAQPKAEQPAAIKSESGNDNSDGTKSDPATTKALPPIDSASLHEHSVLAPPIHPNDSTDASSQPTTVIQPPLPVGPTMATPAAALSVAAASNGLVPVSGLAFEIAASARSGKSYFDIRLDPVDLGRIDVRIDVDRTGRVTSHLTVEKPETLSMLRQDAPQLQRALDDAGFKTGDGGLQFSLRDQSSSGNNSGNETSRNAQRLLITDDDTVPAAIAGRSYGRMLGSTSGVDIRV